VQVLLHELDHRINNVFAFPIGIVSLAAARTKNDEVKEALSAFFHIFSIALVPAPVEGRNANPLFYLAQRWA
jgi:two-component sensor histidine kinase